MNDVPSYAEASRVLCAERLHIGYGCFLLFALVASALEMVYFGHRQVPVLTVFGLYVVVCGVGWVAMRAWPQRIYPITYLSALAAILCMAVYHVWVGNPRELMVMPLVLYLCATTAILPWGGMGQMWASLVAVATTAASAGFAMPHALPIPYALAGIVSVSFVTIPCADWFERLRYAAWLDARRARRAEAALDRMEHAAVGMTRLAANGPRRG